MLLPSPASSLSEEDKRALRACQRAAELGFPEAQFMEGVHHWMRAQSAPAQAAEESAKAVELWLAAAEHGHSAAQNMLSNVYAHGTGVPVNRVEAYKWAQLSEWHKDESDSIKKLKQSMTADEIQQGDALVKAWQIQ